MAKSKPVVVNYSASDFLGGTILLDPWEELAFRRLCDLIYATDDKLPDNNRLAELTKTGKRWPKIRERLIELGKIDEIDGRLSQGRCRDELQAARTRIENASSAGKASAEKRKQRENNETTSTTVPTPVQQPFNDRTNAEGNAASTNHDPRTMSTPSTVPIGTYEGRSRASPVDLEDPKTQLYHRGVEVLGANSGGQITKLLKACGGIVPKARASLEQASIKANPGEYIAAVIRGRRTEEDEAAIRERNIASGLSL